ncbi:hypothetical protein [Myxococcus phage Mx1]|nr:hypothetical protein [Myxococcus phage Mx1]
MPMLPDGTVMPSYLQILEGSGPDGRELTLNDSRLRLGRVVAIHVPGMPSNNNGVYTEYDVEVEAGAGVKLVYPRCIMADPLGGFADYLEWTPRLSVGTDQSGSRLDTGTRVLVLCLNGATNRGVIMGGAKHHGRNRKDRKGHYLNFEFNGINARINDEGEFVLQHKGATRADGTLVDETDYKTGNVFRMNKEGDLELITGDGAVSVFIQSSTRELILSAENGVYVETDDHVYFESAGLRVGEATDYMLLGSTFRQAQAVKNASVRNAITAVVPLIAAAGASLTTAAGLHVIPIAGPIIASPSVAAAGAALTAAAPLLAQISAAIQFFESDDYLSTKNMHD